MKHYSLSEFNRLVKSTLEENLEMTYWIVAEIGDLNVHSKGHCYLELVEKDNNFFKAKLRATIWSYTFTQLHAQFIQVTGSPLQSGMKVLINGSLQFHELYGLSLNINDIDPSYTLGERERKREETIQRLNAEGLLQKNAQLQLPLVPQKIAVISAETTAGYGDFMNQLSTNEWGYQVYSKLFPATMQGETAADTIIAALDKIDSKFELITIIRGGGAKTDLDCFDEYELAVAIAHKDVPVVTGIGHERDETISDLVAHTHLKTPTAVAEFIISGLMTFENQIMQWMEMIGKTSKNIMSENRLQIQHMNTMISQLPQTILNEERLKVQLFEKVIAGSDPEAILSKGFSITRLNGQLITRETKIIPGDQIETKTVNKTITSTIDKVK